MLNINNNVAKKIKLHTLVIGLLLLSTNLFFTPKIIANEVNSETMPLYSISQGALKSKINTEQRSELIKINKLAKIPDQLNNKATSKNREEMLNSHTVLLNKSNKKQVTKQQKQNYYADFSIYGATSFLIDDFDDDGFFQTFSISFDADIYSYTQNSLGEVYALLYISRNGGPWKHYFTTDTFFIEGESDLDEYEVISTFLSGYPTDYYDVLIDLYQVGYTDIVASYSADNSNALYALPLESANYDEPYLEVIEVHNGGSFSIVTLLMIIVFSFIRLGLTSKRS